MLAHFLGLRKQAPSSVGRLIRGLRYFHDETIFEFHAPPQQPNMRVVVTGIGLVSPIGLGTTLHWERLLRGGSAIKELLERDLPEGHRDVYEQLPSRIVGKVDREVLRNAFDGNVVNSKMPDFVQFAQIAAHEALLDAKWMPTDDVDRNATGVAVGAGMSSTLDLGHAGMLLQQKKMRRLSPFFVPRILVNAASGAISINYGFRGPNHAVSTACATGAHAVGDAFKMIQRGDAKVMIAGGTESCVDSIAISGFGRLKALSTKFNHFPEKASRPFDRDRDGFVLSEGAGILVLEEASHAVERGAKIYAEILGYGMSGDAFHITQPPSDGAGAQLAMARAVHSAGLRPSQLAYINAHATSTPLGDKAEVSAIEKLFGENEKLVVSSVKGSVGHLLGAAGAFEAAIAVLSAYHHIGPPNVNLNQTDIKTNIKLITQPEYLGATPVATMSNSFGFGGTNTSLVFGSVLV